MMKKSTAPKNRNRAQQEDPNRQNPAPQKAPPPETNPPEVEPPHKYKDTPPPREIDREIDTAEIDPEGYDRSTLDVDQGDFPSTVLRLGRDGHKATGLAEDDIEEWQNNGRPARGISTPDFEAEMTHGYHDEKRGK
jgi:hypothetical protein